MQIGNPKKKLNLLRLSKGAAMLSGGAFVFQTTGCVFDDVLGANLLNTLLQLVLSIFLGGTGF